MEKEMTFIDLCVAIGRSFGRGCKALGCLLAHMTRLTFRYWWVVITLLVLAVAAALYYSRSENQIYRLNAVALLNGPSIQQFEQAYAPLRTGRLLPADAAINPFLADKVAKRFTQIIDICKKSYVFFIKKDDFIFLCPYPVGIKCIAHKDRIRGVPKHTHTISICYPYDTLHFLQKTRLHCIYT